MSTKKEIRNIILYAIGVPAVSAAVLWLIIEFAPYILGVIALPAWLAAALKPERMCNKFTNLAD